MDQANFEIINEQIKSFISNYQENPFLLPIKRMNSLHKRLVQSIDGIDDSVVKDLLEKMSHALETAQAGNDVKLYNSDNDSYHTLLWQIHQYLLKNHFVDK